MANRDVCPTTSDGYSAKSSVRSVQRVTLSGSGPSSGGGAGSASRRQLATEITVRPIINTCLKATTSLLLRAPARSRRGEVPMPRPRRVPARGLWFDRRQEAEEFRLHLRDRRHPPSSRVRPPTLSASRAMVATWRRSERIAAAVVISARIAASTMARSNSTRARSAFHRVTSRSARLKSGSVTLTPIAPPALVSLVVVRALETAVDGCRGSDGALRRPRPRA